MSKPKIQIKLKSKIGSNIELERELPIEIEQIWSKHKEDTYRKKREQMRRVNKEVFGTPNYRVDNYLKHYEEVIKYIEKQTPAVSKALCGTVRSALECLNLKETPAYRAYYDCYGRLVKKEKTNPYVEVDKSKYPTFTWEDVGNLWNQLDKLQQDKVPCGLDQVYLLMSLYYLLPPLRPQDWINSRVVRLPEGTDLENYAKDSGNIIDMTSHKLVVTDYKTVSTHGVRVIPFNELSEVNGKKLAEVIENWLSNTKNKEYLFTTKDGTPIAEQNINKIFNKINIDEENITATKLRNLFVSDKMNKASVDRRQRLACVMGHTLLTQTFVYSKYNKDLHPH